MNYGAAGLLPSSEKATHGRGWHSILRSGNFDVGSNAPNIWELIFVPWSCLAIIVLCFLCSVTGSALWTWLPFTVLFFLSVGYVVLQRRSGRNGGVLLGILCMVACVAALTAVLCAHFVWIRQYRHIANGAIYYNTVPTDTAAAKNDATGLNFVKGARVDTSMTFGYLDGISGNSDVYCVAPITNGGQTAINFWAVGINCCSERSAFECGDMDDQDAKGGITIPGSPFDTPEAYKIAVSAAAYTFNVTAANNYLLVKWVSSTKSHIYKLWHRTLVMCLIFSGVYLFLSCGVGLILSNIFKNAS
eukprot:CAMPEP_0194526086 /NCGR_PEP_ID=MMETSP0253-20130528/61797_1 /TAXON_ID=2966 /ORGANISM="Noctiluca scintillans" /LENGTH=302 /DNA_ID=CAMNT_0039370879 /DNA_START=65 /DNA_END=973 /DNA_ORIENTATION=-